MKKIVEDMIIKWHKDGYSPSETARLLKRPEAQIQAVIKAYEQEQRKH